MKSIFFVLLAVNVVALALFQFGGTRGGEPMKGHEPFQPEKVKLVSEVEIEAKKTPEPEKPVSPPVAVAPPQCLEWGAIAEGDLGRAKLALQQLKLWEKTSVQKIEKASGYWVFVPPRKSLADAQKKVEELKRLGVTEMFILQDGTQWRYAISLGVFSTEEAAVKYLGQLREKGVRSAEAGPRNRKTDASVFNLMNLESAMAEEVAKLQREFPGSAIKTLDCR